MAVAAAQETSVPGLLVPGNIDLTNRPHVKNPDGSISTVRSIGVNIDGKEVLIPTVVGDRVVSNADAIAAYKRTGQHLGKFDTPEHSTAFAQSLHESEARKLDQQTSGVPDGWQVVAANAPTAQSAGTWEDRGIAGKVWHPASGAKEGNREDNSLLGMPPEFAALSTMAIGRAIGAAGLSAGARAVAGLKATAGQVAPVLKYEATKTALTAVGVSPALATVAATIVAGYKKGAPAAAAEAEVANPDLGRIATQAERPNGPLTVQRPPGATYANPTGAPVAEPVASAPAAPAPVVAAPAPVAPPTPPVAPPSPQSVSGAPSPSAPSPAAAALPDQRALNEAALAARRQAYQQRLAAQASAQVAETTPPAAAAGNVKLSAAETKAFLDLLKRGMSGPDAMKNVLMQRSLVETLGTPTPTAAQTRFPKGQRGKQP